LNDFLFNESYYIVYSFHSVVLMAWWQAGWLTYWHTGRLMTYWMNMAGDWLTN